jgi:hypothetical protein
LFFDNFFKKHFGLFSLSFTRWHREIKNKLKVLKREAYGFRNNESFRLRIFATCNG